MKLAAVIGLVLLSFVLGSLATAAAPVWKVFARGTDNSKYYAYATASADAPPARALAVRGAADDGGLVGVSFSFYCSGERTVPSGFIIEATIAASSDCSLRGGATNERGGTVRVDLLRR